MIITDKYIFILPPKTGSSTLTDTITSNVQRINAIIGVNNSKHNFDSSVDHYSEKRDIILLVRNPYERLVSMMHAIFNNRDDSIDKEMTTEDLKILIEEIIKYRTYLTSFKEIVENGIWFRSLSDYYTLSKAKHIIHLESMQEDLKKLDIHVTKIPWINKNEDKLKKKFYEYIDSEDTLNYVNSVLHDDIINFGYELLTWDKIKKIKGEK
jgi:hypothetical protein